MTSLGLKEREGNVANTATVTAAGAIHIGK